MEIMLKLKYSMAYIQARKRGGFYQLFYIGTDNLVELTEEMAFHSAVEARRTYKALRLKELQND